MNNDYNNNNYQIQPQMPGHGAATGSLVCGIISLVAGIVFGWTYLMSLAGMVVGIVGIILAVNAKKQGYMGGTQTAGLVLSIIGTALSGVIFVSCLGCICLGNLLLSADYSSVESAFEGIAA